MEYCNTSKLSIREINKKTAKKMIVENHYSHLWTKCSVALGIFYETGNEHAFFDEAEEKLIGVCVFGDPVGRSSGESISLLIDRTEVFELTRLFIFDGYGNNIESWFISQSMNWLRKNRPHIRALVSYADPKEGHPGTIYQATNWIYQGIIGNTTWSFKFNQNDRWKHGRTIFPYYGTNDIEKIQRQVKEPFWIRKEPRKHRYIYLLTSKRDRKKIMKNLKYPILNYPKSRDFGELEVLKMEPIR
tara:strand:+ start:558 stop:1292 length:735 start_codon:yes stop_codon:yes gene_type:complete